jgi:hypothetical protein
LDSHTSATLAGSSLLFGFGQGDSRGIANEKPNGEQNSGNDGLVVTESCRAKSRQPPIAADEAPPPAPEDRHQI